jgi:hypothetical protein
MLAISSDQIFARVRLDFPDLTLDEIAEVIMRSLPHITGGWH